MKIWVSPMKILGSPMKRLGSLMKRLGSSMKRLGSSMKRLGSPMKRLGSSMRRSWGSAMKGGLPGKTISTLTRHISQMSFHKKLGPDQFRRFDVYWIQTNRLTGQGKYVY